MDRKQQAFCKPNIAKNQELNPGRTCQESVQCKSKLCIEGVCKGLDKGEQCHGHEDCHVGMYCQLSDEAPFMTSCVPFLNETATCTEDFQCPNDRFCWYKTPEDKAADSRSCLKMYSIASDENVTFGWEQVGEAPTLSDYE